VIYAQRNRLKVVVENIEQLEGNIKLVLSKDSAQFLSDQPRMEFVREQKADAYQMIFVYTNLQDGEYALAVYQDINENNKLDTKKFGIPAEPFAFSNQALRKFGPPYFSQASFEVKGGGEHTHHLKMIYRKPKKK
jgi:uncharacterized protein (DUF2141 family)